MATTSSASGRSRLDEDRKKQACTEDDETLRDALCKNEVIFFAQVAFQEFIEFISQPSDSPVPLMDRLLHMAHGLTEADQLDDDFSIIQLRFPQ
jgi:hypothetical protein